MGILNVQHFPKSGPFLGYGDPAVGDGTAVFKLARVSTISNEAAAAWCLAGASLH